MAESPATTPDYDVLIAGGGLVGGSLAVALGNLSLKVGLIEAHAPDADDQPSFDDRAIALSHGSCRILQTLGLFGRLTQTHSCWPIRRIHVSEQGRFGTAVIDSAEQGVAELGYVIRSRDLGRAIWAHLREQQKIDLLCPARVIATEIKTDLRQVHIQSQSKAQSVSASLLVVADGAGSALRTQLGIDVERYDYQQVALVINVQVDPRKVAEQAYERFTRDGPCALLPGPGGRCTVVMACATDAAERLCAENDADFLARLQHIFGYRLGQMSAVGKRNVYPLSLSVAQALFARRAVLVGSAAHGLHPVAAQGFNLGLRDAACLAELIADSSRQPAGIGDCGDEVMLQTYADWRRPDHRRVVQFTDGLIRGFGTSFPAAGAVRGLALSGFDMLPGAKRSLAHQTMGLSGRMSRLARGLSL